MQLGAAAQLVGGADDVVRFVYFDDVPGVGVNYVDGVSHGVIWRV